MPSGEGLVQLGFEAVAGAVYDSLLEPALDGPVAAVFLDQTLRDGPFEQAQQFRQGVVSAGRRRDGRI